MQWPQAAAPPTAPPQALLLLYVSQVARCSVGRWGAKPQARALSLPLFGLCHLYL